MRRICAMDVNNKTYRAILLSSLFGMAMWLFGNLYEAIVLAPNLLKESVGKADLWKKLFTATNPIFFYIPISPLAMLATVFLYFKTPDTRQGLKKHLKHATIFGLVALIFSVIIITQINLKLFFGDTNTLAGNVHTLAVLWNLLNAIRVILLSFAVFHIFRACILIEKRDNRI